jgi:hypothetical protein
MHVKHYVRHISSFLLILIYYVSHSNTYANDSLKAVYRVLPVAYYTPETHIAGGFIFYTYFKTAKRDSCTRISNTQTYLNYTVNNQLLFQNDYSIFTKGNRFYLKGDIDLLKFPEFYYGIGNNTKEAVRTLIDVKSVLLKAKFYTLLHKQFYVGMLVHYQKLAMLHEPLMSYNPEKDVYGDMGFSNTGLGVALLKDGRNNQLNPKQGHYVEMTWASYYDHSMKRMGFNAFTFDLRGYKTFFNKLVVNTNFYTVISSGEVPFKMMPYIGGPRFLRGFYQGRFRDNNLLLGQVEFRYPLFWRLDIAAFTGIGQVSHHISDYRIESFHYNYGGGIRFNIDRKQDANIRFDVGFTKDSYGFYIVFAEAF